MLSAVTLGTSYSEDWSDKTAINLLLSSLIALGSRRQLTLDIDDRNSDAILWPDHSTIEELTLRCCSYRQFCRNFDRSPNLRTLVLNDSLMRDIILSIRPTAMDQSLTSLTLEKIDIPKIDLEFFLSLQPGLISLAMTTKNDVSCQTFQHLIQWETFLRSTLPHLQKLSLSLSNRSSPFENVESVLLPLSTAFWLEEKRWFFTCQHTESSSFKLVQLSPFTSSTVSFPDYLHRANLSYAITSMRANHSTRVLTARRDFTWLINRIIESKVRWPSLLSMSYCECLFLQFTVPDRNYFRQVTRLAFDVKVDPRWPVDALQRLSAWIDLAQLHELWILEMSPCELPFKAVEYLLERASQVRIFGINYNE